MHQYKEEPVDTDALLTTISSWTIDNPELNRFLLDNGLTNEAVNSRIFSIERLYLTGLFYDPEMQVAYKKWRKTRVVSEHTDYRINPELSIPFEHHSDTSGGQSEWTIGAVLSFIYERKGKREARQADAEVDLLNARLALIQRAHTQYDNFVEHYHKYIISQTKLTEIKNEIEVLEELLAQLQNQYELGEVSQFEISTIKLELQQRAFESSLQENRLQGQKDSMLAITHVDHTNYGRMEIEYIHPLGYTRELYQNSSLINEDIASLQSELLDTHLSLARQLNNYAQAEARLRLEIEKQYPDIVLSPGFIFDQSDNIWTLGAAWILPLFSNSKQNLEILKALEERRIKQQEILALQKKLLNLLFQRYQSVNRQARTITVSDEIVSTVGQQADSLQKQIELGGIDRLALLRNRIEFYKARQAQIEIYYEAMNAMQEFEHMVHNDHAKLNIRQAVTSWMATIKEKNAHEPVY